MDKEWVKLEKMSEWNLTKVRGKKEVIDEARTKGAKVHFASLMDICHLKNAELEAKHQKDKGQVEIRGDIVKDDSGSYAVFTEQGSSASQMTAAKVTDIISSEIVSRFNFLIEDFVICCYQVIKLNLSARSTASPVRLLQRDLIILVRKHTSQFRSFGK